MTEPNRTNAAPRAGGPSAEPPIQWLARRPPWRSPVLALLLFGGAIAVIHQKLSLHHFGEVRRSFEALPGGALALAALLAAVSYALMISTEAMALSMLGKRIPLGQVGGRP